MKRILILLAFFPLICLAQNDKEAERQVKGVVSELKKSCYEGSFTLSFYNAQTRATEKESGKIVMKGNKFHMILGDNETKFDGKTQWMFIAEYNEVSITEPTTEDLREVNPLSMIEYYITKDRIVLGDNNIIIFYPPNPKGSEYFKVELHINKQYSLPSRLLVHQTNGNKITINFENLKKTTLDNSYFVFDTKKYPNVMINDLR